jgi:hypothetical protein
MFKIQDNIIIRYARQVMCDSGTFLGNGEYFTAIGMLIVKAVKNKVKVSRDIALTILNSKKHIILQRFIDMECLHTQKGSVNF